MSNISMEIKDKTKEFCKDRNLRFTEEKQKIIMKCDQFSPLLLNNSQEKDKHDKDRNPTVRFSFGTDGGILNKEEINKQYALDDSNKEKSSLSVLKNNSEAAYNSIKALQEHCNVLNKEKETYKKRIFQLQELVEKVIKVYIKEKEIFNNKLSKEISRINELEKNLRYEISILKDENKILSKNLQTLSSEYSILKSSSLLLEKEKMRHLEQNAIDKEEFYNKLNQLTKENHKLTVENGKLKEFIDIKIEEYNYEKDHLNNVKEECVHIKKDFQKKINSCLFDLNDLRSNYSIEKEDLLNQISNLKDLVNSLEKQKIEIIREYEKKLNQINKELIRVQENTLKRYMLMERERSKSSKKIKKVKEKSISKSNNNFSSSERIIRSSSISNKRLNLKKLGKSNHNEDINTIIIDEQLQKSLNGQLNTIKRNIKTNLNNLNSLAISTADTFNNNKLKHINETIAKYEKQIENLQSNYDKLVEKLNLNLSQNEYEAINNDIDAINMNINNYKDKLFELRNFQKEKTINFNN